MATFDAFYSAFQEKFRGSYDDVRSRFAEYLPELERVGAGSWNGSVLDLGSGRGEWLDILKEAKLHAEGVESAPRLSQQALERGVLVHERDALEYLRNADANRYGAITAFHLIEHLAGEAQLTLMESCYSALRPGGIILIEWPNIEDIRVATQSFWLDPTHVRPLPHNLLVFMAEYVGFKNLRLLRFRPGPGVQQLHLRRSFRLMRNAAMERATLEMNQIWSEFLNPGRDIALIGEKVDADPKPSLAR